MVTLCIEMHIANDVLHEKTDLKHVKVFVVVIPKEGLVALGYPKNDWWSWAMPILLWVWH